MQLVWNPIVWNTCFWVTGRLALWEPCSTVCEACLFLSPRSLHDSQTPPTVLWTPTKLPLSTTGVGLLTDGCSSKPGTWSKGVPVQRKGARTVDSRGMRPRQPCADTMAFGGASLSCKRHWGWQTAVQWLITLTWAQRLGKRGQSQQREK